VASQDFLHCISSTDQTIKTTRVVDLNTIRDEISSKVHIVNGKSAMAFIYI